MAVGGIVGVTAGLGVGVGVPAGVPVGVPGVGVLVVGGLGVTLGVGQGVGVAVEVGGGSFGQEWSTAIQALIMESTLCLLGLTVWNSPHRFLRKQ